MPSKNKPKNNQFIQVIEAQKFINWLNTSIFLDTRSKTTNTHFKKVKRGEVYWCHFGYNIGTEIRKETLRPCVIIQNNVSNAHTTNVIVCPITHNSKTYPCLIPIGTHFDKNKNIILDGNINTSTISTIDKTRLENKILDTPLDNSIMNKVDDALLSQLGLMSLLAAQKTKCANQHNKIQRLFKIVKDLQKQLNLIFDHFEVENFDDLKEKIFKNT